MAQGMDSGALMCTLRLSLNHRKSSGSAKLAAFSPSRIGDFRVPELRACLTFGAPGLDSRCINDGVARAILLSRAEHHNPEAAGLLEQHRLEEATPLDVSRIKKLSLSLKASASLPHPTTDCDNGSQ